MTTVCLRCRTKGLPVLPGAKHIPAPHVRRRMTSYIAMGETCTEYRAEPCAVEHHGLPAANLVRIQEIWNDDTMWDL